MSAIDAEIQSEANETIAELPAASGHSKRDLCRLDSSSKRLLRTVSIDSHSTMYDLLDTKNLIGEQNHEETKKQITALIGQGRASRKMALSLFNIVLKDWMYGFEKMYGRGDFTLLFNGIADLVIRGLPLKFFLPGFPCKSANKESKVLGSVADFSEFLAIRQLVSTARKIEAIYSHGVKIVIFSDYHTFDEYIGVSEKTYLAYHESLKKMIHDAGADNVIELISLSNFPEFKNIPGPEISKKLCETYGGSQYMEQFDDAIREVSAVLQKYVQMKKFMLSDQSHNLPGSPKASATRKFIKEISRGMISQGVALDNFLRSQSYLIDYVRLSIHSHHPKSGKFPIDLFKGHKSSAGILRTPWHHVVVFDSRSGEFFIDHKSSILAKKNDGCKLFLVQFNGKPWFYLRLYFSKDFTQQEHPKFQVEMVKGGCGMIVQNVTHGQISNLSSDCIATESLTNMIKEFGLVVLRGFKHFEDEESMIAYYETRAPNGLIPWEFGPIHKVAPTKDMPGYVNSYGGIPIHFDLVAPPRYMNISQSVHKYDDFICREFLLYCRDITMVNEEGGTTFVDASGATMAMNGKKIEEWKNTVLAYETKLKKKDTKEVYFGGSGNIYEYPLVLVCPWTGREVLRWWQCWSEEQYPHSPQHNWFVIQSSPNNNNLSADELEADIKNIALDERFFFSHSYEVGDQVYVNNYTTLHGRNGFSSKRELWRLQAAPPTDNLPAYYTTLS